jgi:hypothetical protein
MSVIFPKAFNRQTTRTPIEKTGSNSDASTMSPQKQAANVDLLARYKMLRQDILAASAKIAKAENSAS